MRIRFVLFAALCIFAFPLLFLSPQNSNHNPSSLSTIVVLAGHSQPSGRWCDCGLEGGVCSGFGLRAQRGQSVEKPSGQTDSSNDRSQRGNVDPAAGWIFFFVAFVVGIKMRA